MNCNEAARQEWGAFATSIWDNTPGLPKQPPELPPILEDEELPNLPDLTLEEDLRGFEEEDVPRQSPPTTNTPPGPGITQPDPEGLERVSATVDNTEGSAVGDVCCIEEFPPDLGAGAVWGEEVPFFEKLRLEQDSNGSLRCGPFEDHDEWELAQWLIGNTGQNQINAFLKLNIVNYHLFGFHSD